MKLLDLIRKLKKEDLVIKRLLRGDKNWIMELGKETKGKDEVKIYR